MKDRESSPRPPRLAAWALQRLFPDRQMYSTLGDIEEIFHAEAETGGLGRARRWYWLQLLKALPHRLFALIVVDIPMFVLSLKIMIRSLRKHKAFSALTILALTLGLTCFFLIFLYVRYESSYDSFHPDADRIFRMGREDAPGEILPRVPGPAPHVLEGGIPEIEATTQTCQGFSPIIKAGKEKYKTKALFVGEDFFRMFRFPLVRGSERSFAEPGQVVLSERAARRFFGGENPLGQSLDFSIRGEACRLRVSGLLADPPPNTHFVFDVLISYPTTQTLPGLKKFLERWRNWFSWTYVKLRREASVRIAEEKIAAFLDPPRDAETKSRLRCTLQPISDIHLRPDGKNDGAVRTLALFLYLSVLVLAVAVINYINLATSRSLLRRQEVGIRKTVGAGRFDLVKQFIGEAVVLTAVSFVLAVAALLALLPLFNRTLERNLRLGELLRGTNGWEVAGILALVGLAAGFYPAFLLSSYRPARILKGAESGKARSSRLRNVLVVVQFAAASVLVVVTLFIRGQVRFIRNHDPGFDKSGVVEAWAFTPNGFAAKRRLLQNPEVAGASLISFSIFLSEPVPIDKRWGEVEVRRGAEWEPLSFGVFQLGCDADFIPVFNLRLLAGRNFSETRDERSSAIINEFLARRLGPGEAIGKTVRAKDVERTVIGVIKDFYFQPLYGPIGSVLLTYTRDDSSLLYAKFREAARPSALGFVNSVLDEFFPDISHDAVFLEDRLAALYRREYVQETLLSFFSTLAVVIAGLGILGLSAFAVERRTREIGIRKILGAKTGRLYLLLSGNFAGLLAVANILGWPAAFIFVNRWLSHFAYHIPIRPWIFLAAAAGMLALTLLVSGSQIFKISRIDPVATLKAE